MNAGVTQHVHRTTIHAGVNWAPAIHDMEGIMPKFVIEREIPGAGKLSGQELKAISQTSCGVLNQLGPQVQWLQSYVTGDTIYPDNLFRVNRNIQPAAD